VDDGARFRRGLLVHKLLEVLPEIPEPERAARCQAYLDAAARELEAAGRAELVREVLAVLAHPGFARFFGPGSRGEVPIAGTVAGQVISGQVDRLLVAADGVHVLDYKSNRPAPQRESEVAPAYLRQMAAYRALLRRLFRDRPVACALLWTDGPRLMPLSAALLDRHAPPRISNKG
ncbi:MAG: PD-(D/E)XK nuclease family protein, partial [Geminicoccales bacterium]